MNEAFESVHNLHERAVFELMADAVTGTFAHLARQEDLLSDVVCVALNRLPPRYIRHNVDFSFYLSDQDRLANERAVRDAVHYAFEFVQARMAMRARA
jgi:hypothetical protein